MPSYKKVELSRGFVQFVSCITSLKMHVKVSFVSVSLVLGLACFIQEVKGSPLENEGLKQPREGRCFQLILDWLKSGPPNSDASGVLDGNEGILGNPDLIRFFLYPDPLEKGTYEEIIYNDMESLMKARYRFAAPWKILVHGYTQDQSNQTTFPEDVKNAYLEEYRSQIMSIPLKKVDGYNILVVDWSKLIANRDSAILNIPIVGHRIGELIQFLRKNGALESYQKVHLIGFSLGAHIAGITGRTVANLTGESIQRISGLDPAGPKFQVSSSSLPLNLLKLSPGDARFIDLYHTNQGEFGTVERLGDADFYINGGGPVQPFCAEQFQDDEKRTSEDIGSCSHNLVTFYYALTISTKGATLFACGCNDFESFDGECGTKCENQAIFGEYCDPVTKGVYYANIMDSPKDSRWIRH